MSFHFPQVFQLISDRSVWHNGKHPSFPCEKSVQKLNRVVDWFDKNNNNCDSIVNPAASRGTQNRFLSQKSEITRTKQLLWRNTAKPASFPDVSLAAKSGGRAREEGKGKGCETSGRFCFQDGILGDPGAVSGDGEKSRPDYMANFSPG